MSESTTRHDALATERAINEQYQIRAKRWIEETARIIASTTSLSQNSIWTTGTAKAGTPTRALHPLVGRVAFDPPEESPVDGNLYVGPHVFEMDGVTVVSWAAPVAQLLFQGRESTDIAAPFVVGRRTFSTQLTDIIDYDDDLERGASPDVFLPIQRQALDIPAAPHPTRPPTPQHHSLNPDSMNRKDSGASLVAGESEQTAPQSRDQQPADTSRTQSNPDEAPTLRASRLVLEAVHRPRTGKLSSVLATLQPDQYELVTWPHNEPLIVSGAPGTGKTVVAMHRAAFLTHPDREGGPLERVVVVGPTDDYRRHVDAVSPSIGGARIPVVGLPELFGRIAGIDVSKMKQGPNDRLGVTWDIRALVRRVSNQIRSARHTQRNLFDAVLQALITRTEYHVNNVNDPELSDWLLNIKNGREARSHMRYLPLLAAIGMETRDITNQQVSHLIVDEAQDVPPLAWLILMDLIRQGGSITIFGDMNQRRSDWTSASWDELARDLELTDDLGNAPIRYLTTGYRTTRAILQFANQLLPKGERSKNALRPGIPPEVHKVSNPHLSKQIFELSRELAQRHSQGLTVIITIFPKQVNSIFRNAGWRRVSELHEGWTDERETIFVLYPDRARGLEFDAVIVVEPGDFPRNLARNGILYTSLTRATQELHIIHSKPLPRQLRPSKR